MYPQDEFGEVVGDIRDAVTRIQVAKDNNDLVCKELMNMSLDLNKASVLIQHAKQMKRIPSIRAEAKLFLNLTNTIKHWARFKSWDDLCGTLTDVAAEILDTTGKIEEMLKVKQAKNERAKKPKKVDPDQAEKEEHDKWLQAKQKEKQDTRDELARLRSKFAETHAAREALIPGMTQPPGKDVGLPAIFRKMFK